MIDLEKNKGSLDSIRSGLYAKKTVIDTIERLRNQGELDFRSLKSGKIDYRTLEIYNRSVINEIMLVTSDLVDKSLDRMNQEKCRTFFEMQKSSVRDQLLSEAEKQGVHKYDVMKDEMRKIILYQFENRLSGKITRKRVKRID